MSRTPQGPWVPKDFHDPNALVTGSLATVVYFYMQETLILIHFDGKSSSCMFLLIFLNLLSSVTKHSC